jgi:cytochrome b561
MSSATSNSGYSLPSILLHWVGAAFVIALFVIAQIAEDLPRPERATMMQLHYSLGAIAFVVIGLRVLWRALAKDGAATPSANPALDQLSAFVKVGLLITMTVLIITGPLALWTGGRAINVFNVLTLPAPFARNETLHEALGSIHGVFTKVLFLLVVLHVLGALKHLVIDRDGVFRRIFVPHSSK